MERNHIHFAIGEPGENGVISGMSSNAELYIYLDLSAALEAGFEFYESLNKVILCPGNNEGFLPSRFFQKVIDAQTRHELTNFHKEDFNRADFSLTNINAFEQIIHPTSHKNYSAIRRRGLHRTKGVYVNFVTKEPDTEFQVLIYVNVNKCVQDNLRFFQFVPEEILCLDHVGLGLFDKVIDVKSGAALPF
jgi:RNA:NAD 2'-phosphotransferase (TPT1/KptA family)